jgi:hypothetical protein
LKNTPTKHIKYVVNQKLEHCDDVRSRGRFVKIPGVFLSYKIPIHDGVAIAFFMKRSRANLLIGLLVLVLGNNCVEGSKPTERGGQPGPTSLGGPQAKRGKKTRVYLEQGKQNKMCAFVNM